MSEWKKPLVFALLVFGLTGWYLFDPTDFILFLKMIGYGIAGGVFLALLLE